MDMPRKGYRKKNAKKRSRQQRRYNSSPVQKKRRAARNKIRRRANKSGRTRKGDKKDIDHLNRRTLSSKRTRVVSRRVNRRKNSRLGLKRR